MIINFLAHGAIYVLEAMPAKKRNEAAYKPFIGRIFSLRKHKTIPGYKFNKSNRQKFSANDFGEVVLILDETNSTVKVCDAEGGGIWISKFFLHKEIKGKTFEPSDTISDCIDNILNLSEEVGRQSNFSLSCINLEEKLKKIAASLRVALDTINTESSNNNKDGQASRKK